MTEAVEKKRNSKTCITAAEEDDPDTGKEGQTSGRGQRPGKMLHRKGGSTNFWIYRPRVGTDKANVRAAEGRELALTKPPFERPKAASWH
ncbi:hypothetical protein Ddc_00737 [Ditylenchus destructor]|nr:hypothetical protein Ddc_00737 [Ditylenchus destructor]